MQIIEELYVLIDQGDFEEPDKLKQQLKLISDLPGEYNEQVFDKLYELASYDVKAIEVFVKQFVETSLRLLNK